MLGILQSVQLRSLRSKQNRAAQPHGIKYLKFTKLNEPINYQKIKYNLNA